MRISIAMSTDLEVVILVQSGRGILIRIQGKGKNVVKERELFSEQIKKSILILVEQSPAFQFSNKDRSI